LDSVAEAQRSIFTSSGWALEVKLHVRPACWSASITRAAAPAANGEAIEVPLMFR